MSEYVRLIRRPEVFRESFSPPAPRDRDKQARELAWCLSPLLNGNNGMHAWVHGPAGSGKTAIVRGALEALRKRVPVRSVYVNCWDRATLHAVIEKVLLQLKVLGIEARSTSFKIDRLERYLQGKSLVIVLDEIDRMSPMEREDLLYNLIALENVCLICVASSTAPLGKLDPRVRSRFSPDVIEFPPYSTSELKKILEVRAEMGLAANSYDEAVIEAIAARAAGDARLAILALKNAARLATKEQSRAISTKHVVAAWSESHGIKRLFALQTLTPHHRLLHGLIRAKGEVPSGELWDLYLTACKHQEMHPIAPRTYTDYVNRLLELGLVTAEWSVEKGRRRMFRPTNGPL